MRPGRTPRIRFELQGVWLPLLFLTLLVRDAPDPLMAGAALLATLAIHEAGHAGVAIALGGRPTVGLNPFGAHTITPEVGYFSRPRRAALLAAGPLVGLVVAGVVWLALRSGSIPPAASSFALWFAYAGLLINAFNLVPIPGMDGAKLVELAVNDHGHPRRRPAVTALYIATVTGASVYALHVGQPVMLGVVALFGTLGIHGRLKGPDRRVTEVTEAELADDGERLLRLATREADASDACGGWLAGRARLGAAVAYARAGRLEEAQSLLLAQGGAWTMQRLAVDLIADPPEGAARLASYVADRTGITVPPALSQLGDTERLLDLVVDRAPELDMTDHARVVEVLSAADWRHRADRVAASLWQRGLGPDAALLRAHTRGALGDHHGAATWLLAARRAGGDIETFANHSTDLAVARHDPRIVRVLGRGRPTAAGTATATG